VSTCQSGSEVRVHRGGGFFMYVGCIYTFTIRLSSIRVFILPLLSLPLTRATIADGIQRLQVFPPYSRRIYPVNFDHRLMLLQDHCRAVTDYLQGRTNPLPGLLK
jgi:hypothetical protein